MSTPNSNAAKTSLSVPASSPGDRVPNPAAAINGVELSLLFSFGFAPNFANSRIKSASAVRAAKKNGVASAVFKLVSPTPTFLAIRRIVIAQPGVRADEPLRDKGRNRDRLPDVCFSLSVWATRSAID